MSDRKQDEMNRAKSQAHIDQLYAITVDILESNNRKPYEGFWETSKVISELHKDSGVFDFAELDKLSTEQKLILHFCLSIGIEEVNHRYCMRKFGLDQDNA